MTHSFPPRRSSDLGRTAVRRASTTDCGATGSACRSPNPVGHDNRTQPRLSSPDPFNGGRQDERRSEEHTSELQSLMRISYAVFCLKKKKLRHKISSIVVYK